jgi:hypothetical protein
MPHPEPERREHTPAGSSLFASLLLARRGFAGATAPKAKRSGVTRSRSSSARAIMGTLGLCALGLMCVV